MSATGPRLCDGGCSRWLTDPVSIRVGYGPVCAVKAGIPHPHTVRTTRRSAPADQPTLEDHMTDRFAAEIRLDMCDLTDDDLDEIQARIEDALAGWKPTVTVQRRDGSSAPAAVPAVVTRLCGHDDYHVPHEWHGRPGTWCPGHTH